MPLMAILSLITSAPLSIKHSKTRAEVAIHPGLLDNLVEPQEEREKNPFSLSSVLNPGTGYLQCVLAATVLQLAILAFAHAAISLISI